MLNAFKLHNSCYESIDNIVDDIEFIPKGKKQLISNVASVFDIEASSFYKNKETGVTTTVRPNEKDAKNWDKCGCMYAWVFGINGKCIRGRTWEEFENALRY